MQIHYAAKHGDREAVLRQLARGVPIDARDTDEGETPLMQAICSTEADVPFLRFLVEKGADVNSRAGEGGRTPLLVATCANASDKIRFLIDTGADIQYRDSNNYSVLITGCPSSVAVTQMLLDAGADPNGETPWRESSLSIASRESDWPIVRLLLDAGADPAPLRWTPLIQAVAFGTLANVVTELEAGGDLTAQDRWERTPWLHAICAGDIEKATFLLERGSDRQAVGRGGDTALMYAARRDDAPMTEWLLSIGADVNEKTPFGDTALHDATGRGAVHVIPLLLAAGTDVLAVNQVGTQPINEASDAETVRLLTDAGADINYVDGCGGWLLQTAAGDGDAEFVRDLLAMGASVQTTSTGNTALHAAVSADERGVMRLLLDAGADPNVQDVDGWGVLWSVRTTEALKMLLDAGVDVHLTDDSRLEALSHHIDPEIQETLIAAGAAVNPTDTTYGAPLMKAVERGDTHQIQFLMTAEANVNTPTNWGQTALMEAAENSFADGMRLLLNAGADVSAQDTAGRTALHHAAAPEAFTAYKMAVEVNSLEWRTRMAEAHPEIRDYLESKPVDLGQYGYVESDSVECLQLLAAAGADIDTPDALGLTPLLLAASCGRPTRVAGLLALGADAAYRSEDGRKAIDHAAEHPKLDQRELILILLTQAKNA